MRKIFVIQNTMTNKYFSAFHIYDYWSSEIIDAKQFVDEKEAEEYIENNLNKFEFSYVTVLKIWI